MAIASALTMVVMSTSPILTILSRGVRTPSLGPPFMTASTRSPGWDTSFPWIEIFNPLPSTFILARLLVHLADKECGVARRAAAAAAAEEEEAEDGAVAARARDCGRGWGRGGVVE